MRDGDQEIDCTGLLPEVASKLEGKMWREAWAIIRKEYVSRTSIMQIKFGDLLWNKEKDEYFSDIDKEWLQLGKGLIDIKEKRIGKN